MLPDIYQLNDKSTKPSEVYVLVPQGPSKRVSLDFPLDVYDTRDDLTGKHFKGRYHIISPERSTAKDTWFGFDNNLTHNERVILGSDVQARLSLKAPA